MRVPYDNLKNKNERMKVNSVLKQILKSQHRAIIALVLMLFLSSFSIAQGVKFVASAPAQVGVGNQFRVTFSVNSQGSNVQLPAFRDFTLLSGPSQSHSTSMQNINGQVSQTIDISYTYILQAIKEGKFAIPAASINVGGKTYKSNTLTIEVVKGTPQQAQQQGNRGQQQQSQPQTNVSSKDIFLLAVANKTQPYQGEEVLVSYKLYISIPVLQYSISKLPINTGFWSNELTDKKGNLRQYNEVYNGKQYTVADIRKIAVYAQKSGKMSIDPLKMEVVAQVRQQRQSRSIWDDFFGGASVENVKKELSSNLVSFNVKSLPEPRPNGFTGAVGNYTVNCKIDKTDSKTNEPITITFTVSGKGSLNVLDAPVFEFPTDFEVYDPKINDKIVTNQNGVSGSRTFEYLLIPRNPGKFKIKSLDFAFFDPSKGSYSTYKTPEFELNIAKGNGYTGQVTNLVDQKDVKYLGNDIRFIKNDSDKLISKSNIFFFSILYWILLLLPILLFIAFLYFYRKQIKMRRNKALMRNRKASKLARKRLSKADNYLKNNNKEAFYIEISHVLWDYVADKCNIPLSTLSSETIRGKLEKHEMSEELINELILVIDDCEFARFAPGDPTSMMQLIYEQAYKTIIAIEKEFKGKKV